MRLIAADPGVNNMSEGHQPVSTSPTEKGSKTGIANNRLPLGSCTLILFIILFIYIRFCMSVSQLQLFL